MSEQELYMMVEDRGKDEISAQNLMKKHETLEQSVEDYADTIRQLGETARNLTVEQHPQSDQVAVKQSQLDKLYAGLKDLAGERRARLDEALQLFMLNREVDDLEQWINEREVVAGSHELVSLHIFFNMVLSIEHNNSTTNYPTLFEKFSNLYDIKFKIIKSETTELLRKKRFRALKMNVSFSGVLLFLAIFNEIPCWLLIK